MTGTNNLVLHVIVIYYVIGLAGAVYRALYEQLPVKGWPKVALLVTFVAFWWYFLLSDLRSTRPVAIEGGPNHDNFNALAEDFVLDGYFNASAWNRVALAGTYRALRHPSTRANTPQQVVWEGELPSGGGLDFLDEIFDADQRSLPTNALYIYAVQRRDGNRWKSVRTFRYTKGLAAVA